jgi:hypothetical protein
MPRVSMLDLESLADRISNRLRGDLSVQVQRRNGATALDLYDAHGCVKLLAIGPARAIDAYLRAMDETLDIIGR